MSSHFLVLSRARQAVYNAMAQLQGKAGDWEGAVSTFQEMRAECKVSAISTMSAPVNGFIVLTGV